MSDLKTIQSSFKSFLESKEKSERDFAGLRTKLQSIQEKIGELQRVARDNVNNELLNQLEEEQKITQRSIDALSRRRREFNTAEGSLFDQFEIFADPKKLVEQTSDVFPFLLFPVRMETRFMKKGNEDELWIRIYPDDCLIDNFQETLSKSEVDDAKLFWINLWQAGKIEQQQRSAWRSLVASYGSGRATWIYKNYQPVNLTEQPTKANANDVVLTIPTDTALAALEINEAINFWKTVWLADGDSVKEQAAYQNLKMNLGAAVAEKILLQYKPVNIGQSPEPPLKRNDVNLSVSFVIFPPDSSIPANQNNWTKPPTVKLLPEHFVVIGYRNQAEVFSKTCKRVPSTLEVGIDPSLPKNEQLTIEKGNLKVNENLQWMTNFDKAVENGMAVKIVQSDLKSGSIKDGFDRVLVVGLKLGIDAVDSKIQLQELLEKHFLSKRGFALLPQGVATNNTGEDSGFSRLDNADQSYDNVFKGVNVFQDSNDLWKKRDGQWLAELLNLDIDFFKQIPFASSNDQGEARAMNTALWPATLGYFMDEMMDGVFDTKDIQHTREFFISYVSGRGALPAIRIGRQPYGIFPCTIFSSMEFEEEAQPFLRNINQPGDFIKRLYNLLQRLDSDWTLMANNVANVTRPSAKPHQQVLDVVALHPSSVEFHQRFAQSDLQVYNHAKFLYGQAILQKIAKTMQDNARNLLMAWGVDPTKKVPIASKYFVSGQTLLTGDVIDDTPLSESTAVRPYSTSGMNYIKWLATSSLEEILAQDFGEGKNPPIALLYLMLRHGVMEQYHQTGRDLYEEKQIFTDARLSMREPDLLFITSRQAGNSKLKFLYQRETAITNDSTRTVAEYIHEDLRVAPFFKNYYLQRVLSALDYLKDVPTARLERMFAEHLDCCSYRLDAWFSGLVNYRLEQQKNRATAFANHNEVKPGLYLGAYGFVENLSSENKELSPVRLDEELDPIFNDEPDLPPLVRDSTNGGFIHAPSVNQATTAAILKNAYLSHATKTNDEPYSINLSSERVRLASNILEGVRNGQSLAALLGYRFERGLHDKHSLGKGEVDVLIYPIRMLFPLTAKKISQDTATPPENEPKSIEQLEASNVVDGLALINHIKKTGNKIYPFGFPFGTGAGQLPNASAVQINAVTEEIDLLFNIHDAVSDLLISESVYQVVQGNFERAAANTDTLSIGNHPPETDIIRTPRSGVTLTHRVGSHLDSTAGAVAGDNPRIWAEPYLQQWLAGLLPDPSKIACNVGFKFIDPSLNGDTIVTQKFLGLSALDLLYILDPDNETAMNELDDRIVQFVKTNSAKHPGADIKITYAEPVAGSFSFFEIAPLVKSLRKIVLHSRSLKPSDFSLANDKQNDAIYDEVDLQTRINNATQDLPNLKIDLQNAANDAITPMDGYANLVTSLLIRAANYGVPGTGTGFIYDQIKTIYASVMTKVDAVIKRWKQKHDEYNAVLTGIPAGATNEEKFSALQKAERIISVNYTAPLPADPSVFESDLNNFKTTKFDALLAKLESFKSANVNSLNDFLDLVEPTVKNEIGKYDLDFFDAANKVNDIEEERKRFSALRKTLSDKLLEIKGVIESAQAKLTKMVTDSAALKDPERRVGMVINAVKQLFGDSFIMLPKFKLSSFQSTEVNNAFQDSSVLLTYINGKNKFAVDDWMHGVARVREKLFHFENVSFLTEGFKTKEPTLTPMQLPYRANDRWLASEFPGDYKFESDKVLYTAYFDKPFNPADFVCGMVLDEWTETIPGTKENTGLTFHFDQPNTEPPQVMLLVTPAKFKGNWQWNDITQSILETFEMAKKRAVDPTMIDQSKYAQLLPATMMGVTEQLITISTNLALNMKLTLRS
jgi:hypothetical protein